VWSSITAARFGGGAEGPTIAPFKMDEILSGSPGLGILFASACFLGFEATAIYRAEVVDPDRTVPRATYLAVGFITVFYVITPSRASLVTSIVGLLIAAPFVLAGTNVVRF
jgi:amino acid transporter